MTVLDSEIGTGLQHTWIHRMWSPGSVPFEERSDRYLLVIRRVCCGVAESHESLVQWYGASRIFLR